MRHNFHIYVHLILLIFVATDVYVLLKESVKKLQILFDLNLLIDDLIVLLKV